MWNAAEGEIQRGLLRDLTSVKKQNKKKTAAETLEARCKRATVSLYCVSAPRFWSDPAVWTRALDSASPSSRHRGWTVLVRQKHIAGKPKSPEICDFNTWNTDNVCIFYTYFTCEIHINFQHVKYMYLMLILHVFHVYFMHFFFLHNKIYSWIHRLLSSLASCPYLKRWEPCIPIGCWALGSKTISFSRGVAYYCLTCLFLCFPIFFLFL